MKKIIITLIALLLFSPCAFAKTGGPIECVGKGKFALSLDTEYIPEQRFRSDKSFMFLPVAGVFNPENEENNYDINFNIDRYGLELSYGIFDNLDIFFGVGTQREKIDYQIVDFVGSDNNPIRIVGDYNLLFTGGLKAHLCSIGKLLDIGFSAGYLWSKGKAKTIHTTNDAYREWDIMDSRSEYYSWDVSLYFYKRFKFITPYIGAKYQNSTYNLEMEFFINEISFYTYYDPLKFDQDMPWIMFWGCDFHINKRLDANIELSTFGSRSASFGLTWKF